MQSCSSSESASLTGAVAKEELVQILTKLGFTREESTMGLLFTGNSDADLAASWILENREGNISDEPPVAGNFGNEQFGEILDSADYYYKMVLIVNAELKMGAGKIASQVAHACLGLYRIIIEKQDLYGEMLLNWEQFGETKIVLQVSKTAELLTINKKVASVELPHYLVHDAGLTQVAAGSPTVLAIMGKMDTVDLITGELQLL